MNKVNGVIAGLALGGVVACGEDNSTRETCINNNGVVVELGEPVAEVTIVKDANDGTTVTITLAKKGTQFATEVVLSDEAPARKFELLCGDPASVISTANNGPGETDLIIGNRACNPEAGRALDFTSDNFADLEKITTCAISITVPEGGVAIMEVSPQEVL